MRVCKFCGKPLEIRDGERPATFAIRLTCDRICGNQYRWQGKTKTPASARPAQRAHEKEAAARRKARPAAPKTVKPPAPQLSPPVDATPAPVPVDSILSAEERRTRLIARRIQIEERMRAKGFDLPSGDLW